MPSVKAKINHTVLKWWREQLSIDTALAAKKIGVKEARLLEWEAGNDFPTMKQLATLAKKYGTHLTVFYLPSPPAVKINPRVNFRGIDLLIDPLTKYNIEMHISEAYQRIKLAAELYDILKIKITPIPRLAPQSPIKTVAERIRNFLGDEAIVSFGKFSKKTNPYDILKFWKSVIENKDIIISQTSSLNTNLGVPVEVMRGFCLVEGGLSLILLNSKDSPRGRIFTILHELAHIFIGGENEIQKVDFRNISETNLDPEEIFCNKVAAEILVPEDDFRKTIQTITFDDASVSLLSKGYGVSEEVIMRRLLDFGKISTSTYERYRKDCDEKYREEAAKEADDIIVPPFRKVLSANGALFTHLTLSAYHQNKINLLSVGKYLGTKLDHLQKIEHALYS